MAISAVISCLFAIIFLRHCPPASHFLFTSQGSPPTVSSAQWKAILEINWAWYLVTEALLCSMKKGSAMAELAAKTSP